MLPFALAQEEAAEITVTPRKRRTDDSNCQDFETALCWDNNGNLTAWKIRSANTQMDKTCRETTRSKQNFFQQYHLRFKLKDKEGEHVGSCSSVLQLHPKTAETPGIFRLQGEPVKNLHGVLVMGGPTLVNQDRGKCNIAIEDPPF